MRNVGSADQAVRSVLALVLAGLSFFGGLSVYWSVVFFFASIILLLTGAGKWCPIYWFFRIRSCPRPEKKEKVKKDKLEVAA